MIFNLFSLFFQFTDRKKTTINCGDETLGLGKSQVLSDPSAIAIALKAITDSNAGNNGGYVPTVGRWGSEWPSWLAATSFGEQQWLSHGTQPSYDGVCRDRTISGECELTVANVTSSKWPNVKHQLQQQQQQSLALLPTNRSRVDMVGAQTVDMVTADELANELQFLMKTKWTMNEDTYNSDAFDQCEGAWPIAHPLPLPLWSNTKKQPFVVESVS